MKVIRTGVVALDFLDFLFSSNFLSAFASRSLFLAAALMFSIESSSSLFPSPSEYNSLLKRVLCKHS